MSVKVTLKFSLYCGIVSVFLKRFSFLSRLLCDILSKKAKISTLLNIFFSLSLSSTYSVVVFQVEHAEVEGYSHRIHFYILIIIKPII